MLEFKYKDWSYYYKEPTRRTHEELEQLREQYKDDDELGWKCLEFFIEEVYHKDELVPDSWDYPLDGINEFFNHVLDEYKMLEQNKNNMLRKTK